MRDETVLLVWELELGFESGPIFCSQDLEDNLLVSDKRRKNEEGDEYYVGTVSFLV